MSRAALATRPPDAPLFPHGRQFTAQLSAGGVLRFEPDVVRAHPPPSGHDAPTLPAYLQPKRPATGADKPAPTGTGAKADKAGKDDQDKDGKDKKDKAGKDKDKKDGAAAGAHPRDAAAAGAGDKGKGKGKEGAGRGGAPEGADEAPEPDLSDEPVPDTGGAELVQEAHSLSDPSHSYDGPTELTARPHVPAGAQKEKLEPGTETYAALFAEAAAAARRLHDALIADAVAAADAARAGASTAADRRQSALDQSLADLEDGLADARSTLASLADDAASLTEQRAAEAEQTIRRAAAGAKGALAAAQAKIIARKTGAEVTRLAAELLAGAYQGAVGEAGQAVGKGLKILQDYPIAYFPYLGGAMNNAINEAIVTRAPKRAEHRIKAFADELGRQNTAMTTSFGKLPEAFHQAFQTVEGWIDRTGKQGHAAVDRASAAALKQLGTMRRQMLAAIRKGRSSTDATLVRQHNAARAQTIVAHRTRAKSETLVESRRAEQDITGLRALAISQGSAARVLSDGFAKQTDRGEKVFANAVASASRGFKERVAAADGGQRPQLVASAANNLGITERQSRGTGEGLIRSAEAVATQIGVAAKESGDALFSQANDTSSSYAKLADPVSKSIQAYLPPVGDAFEKMIAQLDEAVGNTLKSVVSYYNGGQANEKDGANKGPAPAPPKQDENAPKMLPARFVEISNQVAGNPASDVQIKDLSTQAKPEITKLIDNKAAAVWTHIGAFHVETDAVLSALRSITAMQGAAVKQDFKDKYGGRDIELFIRMNMPKTFSSYTTNKKNVDAAINYLNGNNIEGALSELQAAVNWSNENARIEAVARSLTPAQWAELKRLHPDELKDVRDDLGEVNQQIFDALASEGDTARIVARGDTDQTGIGDASGGGVAKANALRLRDTLDTDLEKRGDKGADKAVDDVETAAINAGNDVISGADPVAGLTEHKVDELDTVDFEKQRKAKVWEGTKTAFDQVQLDRTPGGVAPKDAKTGWGIAAFASQKRQYSVYVSDDPNGPYAGYGGAGDYEQRYGHWETKTEAIRDEQTRLIQAIVEHGPDSDEAGAARVMVELSRDGGKPKPERLDKALHSTELDAHEGEDKSKLKDDEKERRLKATREKQQRVLALVGRYQNPDLTGPIDAEGVRKQITDQLVNSEAGDLSAQMLVQRTMRGPADTWKNEQDERREDAQVAFDYALDHESERGDTLKRTFGRMDKTEIKTAVDEWNDQHPGKGLYEQLNLFGKGSWWTEKLSGDERNDVELAAMGVARNRKEQAEIGRFRAEQQIRDAGWLGHLAGLVTGDWQRLEESRDNVERLMGLPHGSFDEFGRAIGNGHFDDKGQLKPEFADRDADLEVAMNMTHLTAESYKVMTDSLATAVTTALVVIAAVVTTALTGGAAASIWIPVLVTAAAGLTGMALSAAIKGNRYSRAEMERDLVMTFVQAATAGLGAAAGVAIKGGMPALRAVMTEAVVSEKVIEGLAEAAGRQAMTKGWTLVAEMGVGAGTNAINSAAGAAMDPNNRARGESGDKAFDAGMKGLFSGAFGSLLMAPAGAAGRAIGGSYGQRAVGSVVSSVGQRAFEIGYERKTGERGPLEGAEVFDELKSTGVQAVAQSTLEHGAAAHTDNRRARAGAPPEHAAPGGRAPTEAERRALPPDEQHVTPRAEEEPGAGRPPTSPAAETPLRAPPEPIVIPAPPDLAPVVAAAKELRPPELPPVVASPTETPSAPPMREAPQPPAPEQPVLAGAGRPPDEEGPATVKKPAGGGARPSDEEGPQTVRKPGAEEPGPAPPGGRKKPPPLPLAAIPWAAEDFFEGAVMLDPHSTSRAEVEVAYHRTIAADPSREVAIYRNPVTGEHIVIFGDADKVFISEKRGGQGTIEPPLPAGSSLQQRWKSMLPADVGRWELEAHYHPGSVGHHDDAPMWRRLPSTGEGGVGDFQVLRSEAQAAGGQPRESVIHFVDKGRTVETVFGHDPASKTAKYWIDVENPQTGKRERHNFPDIPAYEAWASKNGAHPSRDLATGTPSSPAPGGGAPRPDETLTLRHGTSEKHAAAIGAGGIDPYRRGGTSDDFSRGFYTTLDEPNAAKYGARGAEDARELTPEGQPGPGKVIPVTVQLSELGQVVDVRPGGEHHSAWQEFLDRRPPPFPPVPPTGHWQTAREYGLNTGRVHTNELQRGAVFESFLEEKQLTGADAIRGDLGADPWTHGISAQPGEQIVIRSRKAANLLNERLGYPLIPEEPVIPGSGKSAGAPQEPAGGAVAEHPPPSGTPQPAASQEPLKALPAPAIDPETTSRQAAAMAVDQRAIDAFRAWRPAEGAKLDALLALAPEVVMRAIRGDEMTPGQRAAAEKDAAARRARHDRGEPQPQGAQLPPSAKFHEEALREALAAKGVAPAEIDRQAANLLELLKTPDQRAADYRGEIVSGKLDPEKMDWLAKSGGGIRELIGAVREFELWKDDVKDLDAEARAALPRDIARRELKRYRDLKPTKGANPQRDALKLLDEKRDTQALATDILTKFTGDPSQHAALLTEWETRRIAAGAGPVDIAKEKDALQTVLTHGELGGKLAKAAKAFSDLGVTSVNVEAMALADPVLLALAATNRGQFIDRYVAMMRHEGERRAEFIQKFKIDKYNKEYVKRDLTASDFHLDLAAGMGTGVKSVASEATASFNVAKEMGLAIIKSDSTMYGTSNEKGIDIVAVEREPEVGPHPEKAEVHLFDDKAVAEARLGDVTALTKHLARGMTTVADEGLAQIDKAEKRLLEIAEDEKMGRPVDADEKERLRVFPEHKAALTQMKEAAEDIRKIDRAKLPDTASEDSGDYPHQKVEYADAVAEILKKHHITLHITSEYGQVTELAAWIKRYGFLLWDEQQNRPGASSVSPLPPSPPPTPPPGP